MALSLLESTENGMALLSVARFASSQQAFVFAEPKPAPPPAKPDPVPLPAEGPATEYADAGKSVKFAVSADGSPPLSFQWRKDGQPIAGATGALFAIEEVGPQHAGQYDCIVTNSAGSAASQPFKLVVRAP